MLEDVETGDIYQAAYLVSRGARVIRAQVEGGVHVVLTLQGELLGDEDLRYRTAAGRVEPLQFKENINRLRDLVKKTLLQSDTPQDRRTHAYSRSRPPEG